MFGRFLWIICNVVFLIATSLMIKELWLNFATAPIVTTLETHQFPVENVPFPAVGICNINKMSLQKAKSYANWL